ncbi:MAG TPA: sensor histidine kinase [Stellaceae bacterium]|nr:sensor histidine kinase [Stellaceae bacterium]
MQIASSQMAEKKRRRIPIRLGEGCEDHPGELLLLREMAHRINNELTSTISVVTCTALRSTNREVKVALSEVIEHLHDHARVYRALQIPTADRWIDAGGYLRELCQSISRARLRHRGIELVLIDNPLQLSASQCWRLGLIVAELITNASRHAFANGGGVIRIELKRHGCFAECRVTDDGVGPEKIRPGQGLGIMRQLAEGLDGKFEQCFGKRGAVATVSFPIAEPLRGD